MFKLNPEASYMMPAHFGRRYSGEKSSGWYRDVTAMVVSYVTDREKVAAYVPAPYEVTEDAVITVVYACNKKVDWLAGHGYNLLGVNVSVVYKGEKETLPGTYTLVMWENLADPILTGRELQGIPKVYADIPEHTVVDGKWSSGASHFGHDIVDLSITNLREPTAEEIKMSQDANSGKNNPMGWRYLPGAGGFGRGLNEATTFPSEDVITEALVGEGNINWHQLTWEQNPTQFHIVNALAELPVLAYLPSVVTKGSTNLLVPDRLPRALG
jgi:acetoacetate decarboxylase